MTYIQYSVEMIENILASRDLSLREIKIVLLVYKTSVGHKRRVARLSDAIFRELGIKNWKPIIVKLTRTNWLVANFDKQTYYINPVRLRYRPTELKKINRLYYEQLSSKKPREERKRIGNLFQMASGFYRRFLKR